MSKLPAVEKLDYADVVRHDETPMSFSVSMQFAKFVQGETKSIGTDVSVDSSDVMVQKNFGSYPLDHKEEEGPEAGPEEESERSW